MASYLQNMSNFYFYNHIFSYWILFLTKLSKATEYRNAH